MDCEGLAKAWLAAAFEAVVPGCGGGKVVPPMQPPENRRSSRSTTQPASSAKMSHCQARRGNSASADVLQ